jgi:putative membrane protein
VATPGYAASTVTPTDLSQPRPVQWIELAAKRHLPLPRNTEESRMITSTRRPILAAALLSLAAWPSAFAQAQNKPNDAQIADIAYVADNIDIKAGQLALQKSQNPQVQAFAQDMVRDHTAVNDKALTLLKKLNVKPQPSDTSKTLQQQADAEMKKLQGLDGAAFDKEYAQHELAYHRQVTDAVRNQLIPSAQNPELKQLLEQGLKIFEGHQQHAEQLVKQVG